MNATKPPAAGAPEIDIDDLIARIRQEAGRRRAERGEEAASTLTPAGESGREPMTQFGLAVDQAESKAHLPVLWPPFLNRFPFSLKWVQRLSLKGYALLFGRQRDLGLALSQALRELAALQAQAARQQERLALRQAESERTIAALRERLTAQVESVNRIVADATSVRSVLTQQKHMLAQLAEAARRGGLGAAAPEPGGRPPAAPDAHALDSLYAAFEDRFRGSREDVSRSLGVYLPLIVEAGAGAAERPVLDLGCGRGEWLELLRGQGRIGCGVDFNRVFVEQCQQRGLDVTEGDFFAYLSSVADASLGAVTGFHIIEHLGFLSQIRLLEEALRVLRPGGLLLLETPNPLYLSVVFGDFARDPTHRLPVHPDSIAFFAERCGFARVTAFFQVTADGRPALRDAADYRYNEFADYLRVSHDFALVAYKGDM